MTSRGGHTTEHRYDASLGRMEYRTRLIGGSDWSNWLEGDYGYAECPCRFCTRHRGLKPRSASAMRMHIQKAIAQARELAATEPPVLGDPALAAYAELGRLALAWADSLEALYNTPGAAFAPTYDAQGALLRALLPPGSEALRRHG